MKREEGVYLVKKKSRNTETLIKGMHKARKRQELLSETYRIKVIRVWKWRAGRCKKARRRSMRWNMGKQVRNANKKNEINKNVEGNVNKHLTYETKNMYKSNIHMNGRRITILRCKNVKV